MTTHRIANTATNNSNYEPMELFECLQTAVVWAGLHFACHFAPLKAAIKQWICSRRIVVIFNWTQNTTAKLHTQMVRCEFLFDGAHAHTHATLFIIIIFFLFFFASLISNIPMSCFDAMNSFLHFLKVKAIHFILHDIHIESFMHFAKWQTKI